MPSTIDVSREPGRFVGAATGLLIVVLAYDEAGLADESRVWAAVAVIAMGIVLAVAVAVARSRLPWPGVAPGVFLAVLGVMYLCVPETDQVLVAAIVPVGLTVAEALSRSQLGLHWYALAAASVGWAGIVGSAGRQSALVGAFFAWWPLMLLLLLVTVVGDAVTTVRAGVVVAIGVVAAGVFARTGGVSDSWQAIGLAFVPVAVCSFGLGYLVARETLVGIASTPEQEQP